MPPSIAPKYTDNLPQFLKMLQSAGVALQYAGAEAINGGIKAMHKRYIRSLQTKTRLRARAFTLKAVRIYLAHATRSDGTTLRKMSDINAKIGVPYMKGGKEHYLTLMEVGGTKKGSSKTGNRVPIPLDPARGGNRSRPVISPFRIARAKPEQLKIPKSIAGNPRKVYAYIHSLQQRGKLTAKTVQTDEGIYSVKNKRNSKVSRIRSTKKRSLRVKPLPLFGQAVGGLDGNAMERFFTWAAKNELLRRGLL